MTNFEETAQNQQEQNVSIEIVQERLHSVLGPACRDVMESFHTPSLSVEQSDQSLALQLGSVEREVGHTTREDKLTRAITYAAYQGGTRSPMKQHFRNGDQPFSDMIAANEEVSNDTKKFIEGITNNKASFLMHIEDEPSEQQRTELSFGMRRAFEQVEGKLKAGDLSQADRGALALTMVFAVAASTESWSFQSIGQLIDGDIAPQLAGV